MPLRGSLTLLILAVAAVHAQPDEPHAVVDGKAVSLSDLEGLVGTLPPQMRNPDELFRYYGVLGRLAAKAEAAKRYEQSPYKEQLELQRKQIMAQAAMNQFYKDVAIPDADVKEYFNKHTSDFAVAEVESALIPVKGPEEQDAAMGKARQTAAQMKAGAAVGAAVEHYRKSDVNGIPAMRNAVFALKHDAARPDVWRTPADTGFAAWMEEVRKSVTVSK